MNSSNETACDCKCALCHPGSPCLACHGLGLRASGHPVAPTVTDLDRCTRALYQRDYGAWPPRPGNRADAYNADQCRATAAVVLAALASEGGTDA